MAKEEWGTKRTCPNCGTRFYDLNKNDPCQCIDCAHEWVPEPILKTKQPIVAVEEEPKKLLAKDSEDADTLEDDIDIDIDIDEDDEDVLGDASLDDDDDEEVAAIVDTSLSSDD